MMTMHPAEYFVMSYVEPHRLNAADVAACLGVDQDVATHFLARETCVTAELAVRLSLAFGRSAESWMAMQSAHDLAHAKKTVKKDSVRPFSFPPTDAA
ncbi:HigA family addiction module antidote protein [Oxalobacteraceae bacterium]|nr:HigA family addiction module antidote protein [Oxalobacteraceae bacterium]